MKFTVHQIQIARSVYNEVNALGHEEAAVKFPEYRAYMDTMFRGSKGFKPEYEKYYSPVCVIEAEDLNQVFDIGNIGPEERIERIAPMHSVSVGDIIECGGTDKIRGVRFMVDSMGFKELV
jgi:hypothetical protein